MSKVIICNTAKPDVINFFVRVENDKNYSATEHIGIKAGISSIDSLTYEKLQLSKSFREMVKKGTIIVNDSKLIAKYQEEKAKNSGQIDQRSELVKLSAEKEKLKLELEEQKREIASLKELVLETTGKSVDKQKHVNSR